MISDLSLSQTSSNVSYLFIGLEPQTPKVPGLLYGLYVWTGERLGSGSTGCVGFRGEFRRLIGDRGVCYYDSLYRRRGRESESLGEVGSGCTCRV